jgi:hypothetical protein
MSPARRYLWEHLGALITNISGGNAPSFGAVTDVTGSAI